MQKNTNYLKFMSQTKALALFISARPPGQDAYFRFLVYSTTLLVMLRPGEQYTSERAAYQNHISIMKGIERCHAEDCFQVIVIDYNEIKNRCQKVCVQEYLRHTQVSDIGF